MMVDCHWYCGGAVIASMHWSFSITMKILDVPLIVLAFHSTSIISEAMVFCIKIRNRPINIDKLIR